MEPSHDVADERTAGYAKAMDEVIADNCRMKDIYEPTRDDLLDDMVKITLTRTWDKDEDYVKTSCFLQVHVYKDYVPTATIAEAVTTVERPKNGRTLKLLFHGPGLMFVDKNCSLFIRDYGWHSLKVIENEVYDGPEDLHDPHDYKYYNLMVRYASTGVEFASADDMLKVEPWRPDASLPFGAQALMLASTLRTPPAQAS